MPYPFLKKCQCLRSLLSTSLLFVATYTMAQVKWVGSAGDGQWNTAANWLGNQLPAATDDVVLDNSIINSNYIVTLPNGTAGVTVKSITILPSTGDSIQLVIPVSNTAAPAFTATGAGYGIVINSAGVLINSSGSSGPAAIAVADSIRINNGGQYTHNTRASHAVLVTALSKMPGTEKGIFKFDAPGGGYTFAATNRTYGTLVFSAAASGAVQSYATSAASPLTINGDLVIEPGATVNLNITAVTTIKGDYVQLGGVFNLASQANNNLVSLQGHFLQSGGVITETSTGLPTFELGGSGNQNIQAAGSITNSVSFKINNAAGATLLSGLTLPFKLFLQNGIINANAFLITLQAGCGLQADSTTSTSFINGALRKEGLLSAPHFLFPVGQGTVQRWMALHDATGNFTVTFFKANPAVLGTANGPGIQHISATEYWAVETDAGSVAAAELSFNNVNSGGVTDLTALRVAQLLTGLWTDDGNTATTGTAGADGSVISHSINSFASQPDYFTLASSNAAQNPLPVQLIAFNSHLFSDGVDLSWTIDKAWQPADFELQSSADGIHFSTLSKIAAAAHQLTYQFTDRRTFTGKQFYRLKVVEADGSLFYSSVSGIDVNAPNAVNIELWPSPVKENTLLIIHAATSVLAQVNIYNINGKLLSGRKVFLTTGTNKISLECQSLPAGIYAVQVQMAGRTEIIRLVKM